jgi:hypothetical protein
VLRLPGRPHPAGLAAHRHAPRPGHHRSSAPLISRGSHETSTCAHRDRAVAALIASACAPGSDSDDDEGDSDGSAEVNTDPASLGDVTLTVWDGLVFFQGQYTSGVALLAAGAVIVALPVVILYPFLQRHFIQGIVEGSTRG